MATANFNEVYEQIKLEMDKYFNRTAVTDSLANTNFSMDNNGTIKIPTTHWAILEDYDKTAAVTGRTGSVQEIGDELNTYTVKGFKTFHGYIEETVSMDQKFIRKAAEVARGTTEYELVPYVDKLRMNAWANGAGIIMTGTAADLGNKPDANDKDIIRTLFNMRKTANEHHVPKSNRVFVMSEALAIESNLADRLKYNDQWTGKIVNGQITHLVDTPIVVVNEDEMPDGVDIMYKWKGCSIDPTGAKKFRFNNNVVGSFGTHIEGLFRYDSFIYAQKADGMILFTREGTSSTKICDKPKIEIPESGADEGKLKMTSNTASSTIYYTIDGWKYGLNPKTHESAEAYSSAITITDAMKGKTVRAYTKKNGMINSAIVKFVIPTT